MMKTYVLPVFFFFASAALFAQHASDKWYFGTKAGLDFTSGSPVAISTSEMSAGEGSSSIADPTTGDLLFYTDGINVWNRNNVVMSNGSGLMGGLSSTQAALIVQKPESADEYYIFTTDQIGGSLGFRFSVVDMSLDGGNGDVTLKNVLLTTPVTEKVTAVLQPGSTSVWVVTHTSGDDAFRAFKVTPSGIDSAVVSHVGISHTTTAIQNTYGQMKFNPCGNRLALAAGYLDKVQLFDFDVLTGAVSNPVTISYSDHVYGVEFSSTGDVLYVSTYEASGTLVQYDLTAGDPAASGQIISTTPDIYPLQRAPDGKIYACKSFGQFLGVINSPNSVGSIACNYVENGVDLDPTFMGFNSGLGLPNLVTSSMGGTADCPNSIEGINEQDAALLNSVFPNPSGEAFTFAAQRNNALVTITDISGKELESYTNIMSGMQFRFGEPYAPGVYLVRTMDEHGNGAVLRVLKTE